VQVTNGGTNSWAISSHDYVDVVSTTMPSCPSTMVSTVLADAVPRQRFSLRVLDANGQMRENRMIEDGDGHDCGVEAVKAMVFLIVLSSVDRVFCLVSSVGQRTRLRWWRCLYPHHYHSCSCLVSISSCSPFALRAYDSSDVP